MSTITLPRGLAIFCNLGAVRDDQALDASIAKLRDCGASIAPVMVEGLPYAGARGSIITPRIQPARFKQIASRMRAHGIEPIACSFPAVDRNLLESRQHLAACRVEGESLAMLDAEPRRAGGVRTAPLVHWTPALAEQWLHDDPSLLLTSTRAELPHIGWFPGEVWLQLEQQTSTLTLAGAIAMATRTTIRDRIVPVCGVFDEENDPRTPEEIDTDLHRCAPQGKLSGRIGEWSIASVTDAKARVLRAFVESRPFG